MWDTYNLHYLEHTCTICNISQSGWTASKLLLTTENYHLLPHFVVHASDMNGYYYQYHWYWYLIISVCPLQITKNNFWLKSVINLYTLYIIYLAKTTPIHLMKWLKRRTYVGKENIKILPIMFSTFIICM